MNTPNASQVLSGGMMDGGGLVFGILFHSLAGAETSRPFFLI